MLNINNQETRSSIHSRIICNRHFLCEIEELFSKVIVIDPKVMDNSL